MGKNLKEDFIKVRKNREEFLEGIGKNFVGWPEYMYIPGLRISTLMKRKNHELCLFLRHIYVYVFFFNKVVFFFKKLIKLESQESLRTFSGWKRVSGREMHDNKNAD